jgi:NAD(P)-dependent dehydrogenase (short-subunit alcohol dehydrogenase family)
MGSVDARQSLSDHALNGLTILLASALYKDGIAVNSMCSRWVRTDMGGPGATRSVEEGADTAVWLAQQASHNLTGRFFRDRQEIPWWNLRVLVNVPAFLNCCSLSDDPSMWGVQRLTTNVGVSWGAINCIWPER